MGFPHSSSHSFGDVVHQSRPPPSTDLCSSSDVHMNIADAFEGKPTYNDVLFWNLSTGINIDLFSSLSNSSVSVELDHTLSTFTPQMQWLTLPITLLPVRYHPLLPQTTGNPPQELQCWRYSNISSDDKMYICHPITCNGEWIIRYPLPYGHNFTTDGRMLPFFCTFSYDLFVKTDKDENWLNYRRFMCWVFCCFF